MQRTKVQGCDGIRDFLRAPNRALSGELKIPEMKRMLLVDDDPGVVWGVGRFLTRSGISVTTCGDGQEAIETLQSYDFDVVVTDIQMPRVNGMGLIGWVRQNRPNLLVVVITAYGSPSVRKAALKKGAVLYLEKPVDPELLLELLRSTGPADTFSGTIHNIGLIDYLQLMLISREKTVLDVLANDGAHSLIFIDRGDICHAECGDLEGEQAFYRCLDFGGGTFATKPWKEPVHRTITTRGDFLLMEAARLKDEAGRSPEDRCMDLEDHNNQDQETSPEELFDLDDWVMKDLTLTEEV